MKTFFRYLGILFLCVAAFVFVTWGVGIVTITPMSRTLDGANVYFIPSATGFIAALVVWGVLK